MFFGKVIGGLIGLLVAGPLGLLIGVLVGHAFDRGLAGTLRFGSPENLARIQASFFETTFLLCGHVAKADGRVSEQEIAHTEALFTQLGIAGEQRQRAIECFRRGAAEDFQPEPVLSAFLQTCGHNRRLQQTLLLFLVSLALADHRIEPGELTALQRIAGLMGVGLAQLELILKMARAQEHFHGREGYTAQAGTTLDDAYAALGVNAGATDAQVKRAYRRQMSENHPDKLIARGVPEEMVKLATARSQEVQAAYEMIRKARGTGK